MSPATNPPDDAATVFATGDETNGVFALVTLTLPPHDPCTPTHRHPTHAEGCYVVAGTLALTHEGRTTMLEAGCAIRIPAGATHTFWNPTAMPTTVLLVYQPGVTEAEALALASGAPGSEP